MLTPVVGTIFDRNNIGRMVYKPEAQSLESREAIKQEAKARKELKRLMETYEASQYTVSPSYFARGQNTGERSATPLPVEDEGYSPHLAAGSSKFYSTEPLAPLQLPDSSASSAVSAARKRNFSFFKWTGSRKASNASSIPSDGSGFSLSHSPVDELINTISAAPRFGLDMGPPSLSQTFSYEMANERMRSRINSENSHARSESVRTDYTQYSTAPSSFRHTTASRSTTSSGLLAQRCSNDTLQSAYGLPVLNYSEDRDDATDTLSRFSFSSDDRDSIKPAKQTRTMADLFLMGHMSSSSSRKKNRETMVFSPSQPGGPHTAGTTGSSFRPTTSGSGNNISLRRRHSISSEYSIPRSIASRDSRRVKAPVLHAPKTRAGNEDAFTSMFCGPPKKNKNKSPKPGSVLKSSSEDSITDIEPENAFAVIPTISTAPQAPKEMLFPPRKGSLPPQTGLQTHVQSPPLPPPSFSPQSLSSPSTHLDPVHDPLPSPPSSLLLDAFISLLEEYSSAPKLFSFSRPKAASTTSYHTSRNGRLIRKGSFVSTTHSIAETAAEETSHLSYHGTYLTAYPPSASTDEDKSWIDISACDDSFEEAEFIHEKQKLEAVAWFLSASKWLSFGRLLFSPGHHLLCMGQSDAELLGLDDLRILDLDGPALCGWSWHLALEYPAALVYNITTSQSYFDSYGLQHMQPLNHRLVLTESLTSLQPLESNSFDVITARSLPRILQQYEWIPLLKECHRILKPDGYIELTIVDTLLNNMGPVTRGWIEEHIIDPLLAATEQGEERTIDLHPSKSILQNLEAAGLVDIHKCWVWMPAGSIGDELSSVTSRVGRYFYDELFGSWDSGFESGDAIDAGIVPRHELSLWSDPRVQAECIKENTAFRWLKCHARKGNFPQNLAAAYL